MGDVLTFPPRPKPAAPEIPEPLTEAELRAPVRVRRELGQSKRLRGYHNA